MQDDQKRPTVEDQELATMIANLNAGKPTPPAQTQPATPAPVDTYQTPQATPTAAPTPASSLPPIQPKTTNTPTTSLPPVPPKPAADPVSSLPPIQPKITDNSSSNLPPVQQNPAANNPTQTPIAPAANTSAATPKPVNNFKDIKPTPGLPPLPSNPAANAPALPPLPQKPTTQATSDLASIKQKTLTELRPLVEKLDLPPEERFDTLLLLIRSTDDKSLINQAYQAAEKITDETRRASALLDIVKEIDYFESK